MQDLLLTNGSYTTAPRQIGLCARLLPSMVFYADFVWTVYRASRLAKQGLFDGPTWARYSLHLMRSLESVGVRFSVEGVDHLDSRSGPYVIVANHMSVLETVILPGIIQPIMEVTFVVKQSLLSYPVFRHVLASRHPIAVTRTNPRRDLQEVLRQGAERLSRGVSVVVFPQTTRTTEFDPGSFNTIGVKLAASASVPVLPLALRTDAWPNGRLLKDFGRLQVQRQVHIAFGSPLPVQGRGLDQHRQILAFIQDRLQQWGPAQDIN